MRENGKSRTRRRQGLLRSIVKCVADDQMGSVVLTMLLILGILLSYVGVYAKVTTNGYRRASQVTQLRDARVENQRLRADIQTLRSPERLSRVAQEASMQQCQDFDYLSGAPAIVVAQASRD